MIGNWIKSKYTILFGILILAAGLKIWLITSGKIPFDSDEAVVGLMARHIQAGERPIFFYGQAYMGSLDAFLVAAGFALFGQQVWVIRLVQTILYLGTITVTFFVAEKGFQSVKAGLVAALLMAIPAVNTTLYTTASLGGYGEAILIGSLILLVALEILNDPGDRARGNQSSKLSLFSGLFGFLSGMGLWAFGLSLIFTASAGITIFLDAIRHRKKLSWIPMVFSGLAGFLLGSAPWWSYAVQHGFSNLVLELSGSAVAVESGSLIDKLLAHGINFFLLGLPALWGLRPPWEVRWLTVPLIPFVLAIWVALIYWGIRTLIRSRNPLLSMAWGVIFLQAAAFLLTPFGIDPSGRYFLPLVISFALTAGYLMEALPAHTSVKWGAIAVLVAFQLGGNVESALRFPPGITTQFGPETRVDHTADGELVRFLQENGETTGYTNYWVSYPMAFLSSEKIIFVPDLPYHLDLRYTPRDDRYQPYAQIVQDSPRVALITTGQPALEKFIREYLREAGIHWSERKIGDYLVFYHLTQKPEIVRLTLKVSPP
ncbi:MAG TPA: hypothetical protein VMT46_08090 [Anaerolineaceae bacterium]|nr:hypothetical protein [Anaerolineaceae bacterium]